jgi:hypothetical protein
MTQERQPVRIEARGPAYWRVTFDNLPFNLNDPELEGNVARIVDQLEADSELKVVVFDSALDDYMETDMTVGVKGPKSDPAVISRIALDGVEAGEVEILADEVSLSVRSGLRAEWRPCTPSAKPGSGR